MSRENTLSCPRCGYDVSGVVPTWAVKCPLEGTCSECGLNFAWVDIFRPDRIAPAWSFEHGRDRLISRWFATVGRTLVPTVFWTRLRLGARLRYGRLILIALPLLLAGCAVAMGCGARWGYLLWNIYNPSAPTGRMFWRPPPSFSVFKWFGEPWDSALTVGLMPWRRILWEGSILTGVPTFGVVWAMLVPLQFLVLGQSLSRAKCRRAHLARGWAFQWAGVLLLVWIVLVSRVWPDPGWAPSGGINNVLAGGVLAAWMGWYWCEFTRAYLRLPRPQLVALVMLTTAAMETLVFDWATAPNHESMIDDIGSWLS